MTDELLHQLKGYRDERGVVAWCSRHEWGYAGPGEDRARELYAAHAEEAEGRDDDGLRDG
jgi:hypothetical protein